MSQKAKILKIALPLIIIIAGFFIMKMLIAARSAPERKTQKDPGILVEVFRAAKENTDIIVNGTGTVEAAEEISVIPQVSGQIMYTAPGLNVGAFFQEGSVLFRIEDTDYKLSLEQAISAGAKAEFELATIESQARIARSEWDRINRDGDAPPNPLVLYEPQLKSARAGLASASAQVEQAKVDLERTIIKAPFNARIRSENIALGQYVKSGNSVAVLAGTDRAEIAVPLRLEEMRWIDIPRHGERQNGADATITLSISSTLYTWHGHVIRSTGEVDPRSRMMQLVVEVRDPYRLEEDRNPSHPALAAGTFVDVQIKGKKLNSVFVIPRAAFRDDSSVWIMNGENILQIKRVAPLRMEREQVIIGEGIGEGDMIILTNISGAANGMKLRTIN